jgi:hypothetical protein
MKKRRLLHQEETGMRKQRSFCLEKERGTESIVKKNYFREERAFL